MHSRPFVIVALGAGLDGGAVGRAGRGRGGGESSFAGLATRLRALAAAALYRKHPGALVILSGGRTLGRQWISEGEAMRAVVTRPGPLRVPARNVLVETESLSTPENVRNVVVLLRTLHISPDADIRLIAGRRNRFLAAAYFRAHGYHVRPYTVRQILAGSTIHLPPDFEPRLTSNDGRLARKFRWLRRVDPKGIVASAVGRWGRGG